MFLKILVKSFKRKKMYVEELPLVLFTTSEFLVMVFKL